MLFGPEVRVLQEVTMREIEAIFAVTDRLGISREALVDPAHAAHAGPREADAERADRDRRGRRRTSRASSERLEDDAAVGAASSLSP